MTTFAYRARKQNSELVTGTMEAATPGEIAKKLQQLGYVPTTIQEATERPQSDVVPLSERFTRVKTADLIIFNMQLSNLVDAGIPLLSSLLAISKQLVNPKLKKVVKEVSNSVAAGMTFSDALEKHPKVFSFLFTSMVHAGEAGGNLGVILLRYASYVEEQEELKKNIQQALYYPIILMLVGLASVIYIVTNIFPKFIEIFDRAQVALPLPTRIFYNFGQYLVHYWVLILLFGGLIYSAARLYLRTPRGHYYFDRLKLSIPAVGALYSKVILSRFSRTLAALLNSGVPMLQSLTIVGNVVGNKVFYNQTQKHS